MGNTDIRWVQRFTNYKKALKHLKEGIEESKLPQATDTVKAGVIQLFETTYELAWNTMKDFYENKGEVNIHGSRDAIKLAFNRGLIEHGEDWMEMVASRKLTTHTYDKEYSQKALKEITDTYFDLFVQLQTQLEQHT